MRMVLSNGFYFVSLFFRMGIIQSLLKKPQPGRHANMQRAPAFFIRTGRFKKPGCTFHTLWLEFKPYFQHDKQLNSSNTTLPALTHKSCG